MREILGILIIGFAVIGGPVVFLLLTLLMPWYLIILYFIWVVGCLATIAFSKVDTDNWKRIMIPSAIITLFYAIIYMAIGSSVEASTIFEEDEMLHAFAFPFISLPAFYFIGKCMNKKVKKRREIKRKECLAAIDKEIAQKTEQISELWHDIGTKSKVNRVIELLSTCGEDVSDFMGNNEINNTKNTELAIKKLSEEVEFLREQKKKRG